MHGDGPRPGEPAAGSGYRGAQMAKIRKLLPLLPMLLPQRLKRAWFRRVLGWDVADDAYVGFSYIDADEVTLGPGSRIGHLNIVRNIRTLELGARTFIKDLNDIFGCTPLGLHGDRSFRLGDDCHIMSRHFFEVGGSITIGSNTLIGGRGTQIYTHSLISPGGVEPWKIGEMVIGDGAKVFARTTLIHCRIPPGAMVVAGAVLTKSYEPEPNQRLLIGGNPAVIIGRRPVEVDIESAVSDASP
jgi:acetyltransferase-like isoleucine patch superfamily enzyme